MLAARINLGMSSRTPSRRSQFVKPQDFDVLLHLLPLGHAITRHKKTNRLVLFCCGSHDVQRQPGVLVVLRMFKFQRTIEPTGKKYDARR